MRTCDDMKHDGGKPRFELMDPYAEEGLAMVLTAGALEYEDDGWWRLNTPEGRERLIGSTRRHLGAYHKYHRSGVATDPQFGLPHSVHLLACAHFLAAFDVDALRRHENPILGSRWRQTIETWQERLEELKTGKQAKAEAESSAKYNAGPCP